MTMITADGRRCDVRDCRGVGVHYASDKDGHIGDVCPECFALYNVDVLRGGTPQPKLECQYCGRPVPVLPVQFTKAMELIDNRQKRRTFTPKFICPSCTKMWSPFITSKATLSIGTVVLAEGI